MGQVIVSVEQVSKKYQIAQSLNNSSLREKMGQLLSRPARLLLRRNQPTPDAPQDALNTLWALKDVSFDVKQGEVLGILGPNGSGKSTLLRILNRISRPTKGRFRIYGRLGSLLDIGTGFHPDLTGRENVFMNGSILGMRRHEIERKFEEIIHFAEIERFIDTQVKFYSSGMYVRLAFSVASHLDSDVLLLDEVLGVGDYGFQQKSSAKLVSMVKDGRTVLLVSHIMPQIQQLCSRVIWLQFGELMADGDPATIIPRYLQSFAQ
jgi:lipopolysaccharide transport system ATP-binding protein